MPFKRFMGHISEIRDRIRHFEVYMWYTLTIHNKDRFVFKKPSSFCSESIWNRLVLFLVCFVAAILSLICLDYWSKKSFSIKKLSFLCLFAKNNIEILWSEIVTIFVTFILFLFHANCFNNKAKGNIGFFCNNISEGNIFFLLCKRKNKQQKGKNCSHILFVNYFRNLLLKSL
jgi:hypothetical protein